MNKPQNQIAPIDSHAIAFLVSSRGNSELFVQDIKEIGGQES